MTSEDDLIGEDAAAELARLQALEDTAWSHQNISQAPPAIKVGVGILFIVVFAGQGVLARSAASSEGIAFGPVGLLLLLSGAFVFVVTRLERYYAPIKAKSVFPPKRVRRKYNKLNYILLLPLYPFVMIFLFFAVTGRPWPWFAVLACAILAVTVVWGIVIKRFGIVERLVPPEPDIQ